MMVIKPKHVGDFFNVNFNILFKAILLCIGWYIKNSDNIKMLHGTTVEKKTSDPTECFCDISIKILLSYLFKP